MDKLNRRKLFKLSAYTIASLPLFKTIKAFAAEKLGLDACPVAPTDAKVKKKLAPEGKYDYILNSTASTHKKYTDGSACGNCKFYKAKIKDGAFNKHEIEGYSKCSMLGNKYVGRCGWCNKYKQDKKKYAEYKRLKG